MKRSTICRPRSRKKLAAGKIDRENFGIAIGRLFVPMMQRIKQAWINRLLQPESITEQYSKRVEMHGVSEAMTY